MRQGYTLIEILVVVLIIGILATLAAPQFAKTKERALDKEAQATLRIIQAAERIYHMEIGAYWPGNDPAELNPELKLSLPESGANWDYSADILGTARATRTVGVNRLWELDIGEDVPTCSGGSCP
jgi:prepilin-type N-terminal cleavage/methylation domain-containing protein